jgi:CHAT domain-containing protein
LKATAGPTADDILTRLPESSILHLACHGHQERQNPLDSGFVLRDRLLTVAQLTALNLPNALMAFLSACDTAKGDETQPDEAVHLAATMLFAGFQSVIGTMW